VTILQQVIHVFAVFFECLLDAVIDLDLFGSNVLQLDPDLLFSLFAFCLTTLELTETSLRVTLPHFPLEKNEMKNIGSNSRKIEPPKKTFRLITICRADVVEQV
jgi:hypothetical protein